MNFENIRLKNQLCHPLYSASNALMRLYDPVLKPLNLTYPQYLIMMALWEEDDVNISRLSELTFFDSGTLSPLIKKLAEKDYISVKPSPEDQRHKLIKLTKKGEKLKLEAVKVPELLACQMQLSVNEFLMLKKLLEKLRANLVE